MTFPAEEPKFEALVRAMEPESRLLRAWVLTGGVSAQVTALEIARPDGETVKMIVRQHGAADLLHNPQIAADEFRLLHTLRATGLPVPMPYYLDATGAIFGTPVVVAEFFEATTEFSPANPLDTAAQLAAQLTAIHAVDLSASNLSFLPDKDGQFARKLSQRPAKLDDSLDEGRIRDTLEQAQPLLRRNQTVLLHGDFWPGNILWREGKLVAVIDWEDAALGDPLADFANSRLEVLWAFGAEAMDEFSRQYRARMDIDFTNLPYWELYAALRPMSQLGEWANSAGHEKAMREGHRAFVRQIYDTLAAR